MLSLPLSLMLCLIIHRYVSTRTSAMRRCLWENCASRPQSIRHPKTSLLLSHIQFATRSPIASAWQPIHSTRMPTVSHLTLPTRQRTVCSLTSTSRQKSSNLPTSSRTFPSCSGSMAVPTCLDRKTSTICPKSHSIQAMASSTLRVGTMAVSASRLST